MSKVHETEAGTIPETYGEDRITLLARDPNCLYAYWEITDKKIEDFKIEFGEQLYSKSLPVLKVNNISRNESYYIRINDFSGSWYINVPEVNNIYVVEIGRKISENFFVSFAASNIAQTPGVGISSNTGACFVNINDPDWEQKSAFEVKAGSIINFYPEKLLGETGLSSGELFAKRLSEFLGISSGSF